MVGRTTRSRVGAAVAIAIFAMADLACGGLGQEAPTFERVNTSQAALRRVATQQRAARIHREPRGEVPAGCPDGMSLVDDRFCIDRYEASLVELRANGTERPWSAYRAVDPRRAVRAASVKGVAPQGYISALQAKAACARSGKRLCRAEEWLRACRGPEETTYGYGEDYVANRCNDNGRHPVITLFGPRSRKWNWDRLNHPLLNQVSETLATTGSHAECTNGYGVFDMIGNLHEWVADDKGTFLGGYYGDVHEHGEGCDYRTVAHSASYHDYSTGFRCCADLEL